MNTKRSFQVEAEVLLGWLSITKRRYFGHLMRRTDSLEKTLMLGGKDWGQKWAMEEDEMVGWHHWLNGHEFEQTLGESEGQGCLAWYSPWGHGESDMMQRLNKKKKHHFAIGLCCWPAGDQPSVLLLACHVWAGPGLSEPSLLLPTPASWHCLLNLECCVP